MPKAWVEPQYTAIILSLLVYKIIKLTDFILWIINNYNLLNSNANLAASLALLYTS